jgi:kinesin family protein 5
MSSIRVICRLRPENSIEKESGSTTCVSFTESSISIKISERSEENYEFTFDRVFSSEVSQKEVFEAAAKPVVQGVLDGYNGTIFAYGQTGSGKTYTMEGFLSDPERKGIIPRMMDALFQGLVDASESTEFTLRVSFLEIYLERIHDLLDSSKNNLQVKEDKVRGIYVQNSTELFVSSPSEMMKVMMAGSANRSIAATRMNERSSRSHSIFCVNVEQKDSLGNKKTGRLYFVDLAGSESVGKTNVSGQQLKEAQMINKSLSALGNVINALTEKGCNYVPYRDSKLTRILQESIGGNSQTSLIIACSMSSYNDKETLGTLRFGQRAKKIQNKPVINQEKSAKELQKVIETLQNELKKQSEVISKMHSYISNNDQGVNIEDILVGTFEAIPSTRSKEEEVKSSEYALTLLKQHIEIVKLNDELQKVRLDKKEVEDELHYRNKEMNELELNLSETQQNLIQTRQDHQKTVEDLQGQVDKSSSDLQQANLTIQKTTKICGRLKSDLQIIASEIPKGEKWSEILQKSLEEALYSLNTITENSPESPTSDSQMLKEYQLQLFQYIETVSKKSSEIEELSAQLKVSNEDLQVFRSQCELLTRQLDTKVKNIEEERASTACEMRYKDLQILELQESVKKEKMKFDTLKASTCVISNNDMKDRLEELTQERQKLFEEIVAMRRELDEREEQLHASLLKNKRLERQISINTQAKPVSLSRTISPTEDLQTRFTGKVSKPIRGGGGNFSNFQRNNQIITSNNDLLVRRKSIEKIANQGYGIQSKIKDLFGGLLG